MSSIPDPAKRHLADGIVMTPEALLKATDLKLEQPDHFDLRLYLDGKGCDGFYYGVTFDRKNATDLVFDQQHGQVRIVVDPQTYIFVQGSTIDWVNDERGQGFLVANPRERQFRGKFFKRQVWQERLSHDSL